MKITRVLLLLMLILTLTLVATSCDVSDLIEETLPHEVESRFDNLEDRIENEYTIHADTGIILEFETDFERSR